MDINDIIRAVLSGSPSQQRSQQQPSATPPPVVSHQKGTPSSQPQPAPSRGGGDVLGDILGSIFGGSRGTPRMPNPTPQSSPMGNIPVGDILSTMMGAGLGSIAANTFLAPIINDLAAKFHIPPRVAQMVVAFALAQLLSAHMHGGTHQSARGGFQLNQMLDNLCSQGGCSESYLEGTGMPQDLAERTGLDAQTSNQALQYALNTLGQRLS